MNQERLRDLGMHFSIAVILVAVPMVLWPAVMPGPLRYVVIALYGMSGICTLLRDHRSGALYVPLSKLPQFAVREKHNTLHLCATVMAMWVIFFSPD